MIYEWWWQAIGGLLFLGLSGAMFLNMYEVRIVTIKKVKVERARE